MSDSPSSEANTPEDNQELPEPNGNNPSSTLMRRIVLGVIFIAAIGITMADFSVRSEWMLAREKADTIFEEGNNATPAFFMREIGLIPHVYYQDNDGQKLTQVYKWAGCLGIFILQIDFEKQHFGDDVYLVDAVTPQFSNRFSAKDLTGMTLAKEATGTPEAERQPFIPPADDAAPMGPSGSGGPPGSGGGGRGFGSGNRGSSDPFNAPEGLGLTEEQKKKWETAAEFSKAASADAMQQRAWTELRAIRDEFRKEIEKFLKPDQLEKFDAVQSQGRGNNERNRRGRPSNPPESNRTEPSPSGPVGKQN